ncbi:MAG TPA: MASE3 domain-containing protein [Magnetospirillum sp.]|nr:MASE3 domain-containing protein [Magnetospirillum sp.]
MEEWLDEVRLREGSTAQPILGSGAVAGFGLLGVVLCAVWASNFLLFHTLAEMFSVVVGFATALVAWYSREWVGRNYLLLLGLGGLFVGAIDTVHTFGYKGVGILSNSGGNLSTQLWLSARLLEGVTLLVAVWAPQRRYRIEVILTVLTTATVLLILAAFADIWPATFIEGQGVTPVKTGAELVLVALFLAVLARLRRGAAGFDPHIYRLLMFAVLAKVITETAFVWYIDLFGLMNFLGHGLKIVGAWLLLRAVVDTGMRRPHALIFGAMERERALSDEVASHAQTLDAVLDATLDPVMMCDVDGRIRFASRAAEEFFGRRAHELAGRTWREAGLSEAVMGPLEDLAKRVLAQGAPATEECWLTWRHEPLCLELQASPVGGTEAAAAVVAVLRDITARKTMEEDLKTSLADNRVLMQEVHHRVKNNLQIVSSILQMQGWRLTDTTARQEFEDACGRILSLAKVHELLYKQDNVAALDFSLYVRTLCAELFRAEGVRKDRIELKVDPGPMMLAVDKAEPLALIVHELVADAVKRAFGDGGGQLRVTLLNPSADEGAVVVADNGVNSDRSVDFSAEVGALGLRMVGALVRQLHGSVSVRRDSGIQIEIRFPLNEAVKV